MVKRKSAPGQSDIPPLSADDISAFRDAVREAKPLPDTGKITHAPRKRKPVPKPSIPDEQTDLVDFLSDHIPWQQESEPGEALSFLRPGLAKDILRKLRKGHWLVQSELDLHGMTSDEARLDLVTFLNECQREGLRCVRIIHGKGLSSKNGEPVLKNKVRNWLMQRAEILAFCQAKPADGGGGAAIVLLKST